MPQTGEAAACSRVVAARRILFTDDPFRSETSPAIFCRSFRRMYSAACCLRQIYLFVCVSERRSRFFAAERTVCGHDAALPHVYSAAAVQQRDRISGCAHPVSFDEYARDLSLYPAGRSSVFVRTVAHACRHGVDSYRRSFRHGKRYVRYRQSTEGLFYRKTCADRAIAVCPSDPSAGRRGIPGRQAAFILRYPAELARQAAAVSIQQCRRRRAVAGVSVRPRGSDASEKLLRQRKPVYRRFTAAAVSRRDGCADSCSAL